MDREEVEVTEFPIVTFDSANPQTVGITLTTEKATIRYRMEARKGLRLRFLLGGRCTLSTSLFPLPSPLPLSGASGWRAAALHGLRADVMASMGENRVDGGAHASI